MRREEKTYKEADKTIDGVGKKFLIISISLTILLNGSVALWFFWYTRKYGIEKFIS